MAKRFMQGFGVLALAILAVALYRTFHEPADLWALTGTFPDCPSRPSCVSSVAQDEVHRIDPLTYSGDAAAARTRLESAVKAMPDTRVLRATPEYLHVLFLTPRLRFHDDLELLVQPGGTIQVRSLSRFGYRDHGVNRARVEALRAAYAKQPGA